MAERRMMSKKIVDSDAFMDMPLSTQALYFHLLARADDDGFVGNPKKIMKMVGANDDDFKVLITKRFVLQFPSGVCVIKHWLIHNLIRHDRYSETQYLEEKNKLEIKENKSYTEWQPNGNQLATQYSIGKVSIGKVRDTTTEELIDDAFWEKYPEKVAKAKAYQVWKKMTKEEREKAIIAIKKQVEADHFRGNDGKNYIPHPATWLNQKRWEDEIKEKPDNKTIHL